MELAHPFGVFVFVTVDTLGRLSGISMHDLCQSPKACITAFTDESLTLKSCLVMKSLPLLLILPRN